MGFAFGKQQVFVRQQFLYKISFPILNLKKHYLVHMHIISQVMISQILPYSQTRSSIGNRYGIGLDMTMWLNNARLASDPEFNNISVFYYIILSLHPCLSFSPCLLPAAVLYEVFKGNSLCFNKFLLKICMDNSCCL